MVLIEQVVCHLEVFRALKFAETTPKFTAGANFLFVVQRVPVCHKMLFGIGVELARMTLEGALQYYAVDVFQNNIVALLRVVQHSPVVVP